MSDYSSFLPQVPQDFQLPIPCGLLATDTETGGLDPRLNPLLSVSVVAATNDVQEIDGVGWKVRPELGTVLEIVDPAHCWVTRDEVPKRRLLGYLDVYSMMRVPRELVDQRQLPIIASQAAEINGYVTRGTDELEGFGSYPYSVQAVKTWHAEGLPAAEIDAAFERFVRRVFINAPIPVAHNAPFDDKFVFTYLPKFYASLGKLPAEYLQNHQMKCGWLCTMSAFRRYLKHSGQPSTVKGSATLETLVKTAGADQHLPHDALADARSALIGLRWLRNKPGVF